jgi:uncharacterized iron-regulated membrane protein
MKKFLNKWLRKIHRWLVLPTVALMIVIIFTRNTPLGSTVQRFQFPLMLIMAITGLYLWLIPYLVKWSRKDQ